jgi:glycosyltransferase involved in cell wall biosynthesis
VHLIPHGAADALVELGAATHEDTGASHRPLVLTWGLLGPGKGIEWAIDALAELTDLDPAPLYVVAGRTHPRVVEQHGEQYRDGLRARAVERGVGSDVVFDDHYLSPEDLHRLVRAADVVLLPYDSVEQVTSGVLIEAVAAGRPVVSTRFPHAVELLEDGAGLLVDQCDPAAIAAALRRVLTDAELAAGMSGAAQAIAPDLSWHAVAGRYLAVGRAVRQPNGTGTRPRGGTRPVAGRAAVDVRSSVSA